MLEPNYKIYSLLRIEMIKIKIKMNKPVYLGLSILNISKIVMYEYCYNYLKLIYGNSVELYCMDPDSFIVRRKKIMFMQTLQKILRKDLTHQNMKLLDHYQ